MQEAIFSSMAKIRKSHTLYVMILMTVQSCNISLFSLPVVEIDMYTLYALVYTCVHSILCILQSTVVYTAFFIYSGKQLYTLYTWQTVVFIVYFICIVYFGKVWHTESSMTISISDLLTYAEEIRWFNTILQGTGLV